MNITVIGSGYVGTVTAASLANLGHQVLAVDIDPEKIALLRQGQIFFYEPGLPELLQHNLAPGRLSFSADIQEGLQFGEVIFNCVGTPAQQDGAADLTAVWGLVKEVAKAESYKVLINKSTVPPGTARRCHEFIRKINPQSQIEVVSNPEFLKQGNAVYDFNHPDKIVVGTSSEKARETVQRVYRGLLKPYLPYLEMEWETAEMVKYANNAFLATKISFINEIANLCRTVGADVKGVSQAMGLDQRIGPKFLNAGIGYGGSCFSKDVLALIAVGKENGYYPALLQEVEKFNERQKEIFLPAVLQALPEAVGNTVTLWGLSFKPKTSDVRGATSLRLIEKLLQNGIKVVAYDPAAMEEVRRTIGGKITYASSLAESIIGSNAIILVTEWDEFRNVDFLELGKKMKSKIIFDGRNIYDPQELREAGFQYLGVGR